MTRVLITGGAGYVGSVSAQAFLDAGHDVVVLDDLTTGHRDAVPAGAKLRHGHVRHGGRTGAAARARAYRGDPALRRPIAGRRVDRGKPAKYYRENVAGGVALLDAARAAGVGRVVFSSTAAVYGDPDVDTDPRGRPASPDQPVRRDEAGVRGCPRLVRPGVRLAERLLALLQRCRRHGPAWRGPPPETHLIPNVLRAAAGGPGLTVFGDDYPTPDGTCIRDYIHVSDLAEAHLLALAATATGDPRTDEPLVCNLGNGGGFSVREVLAAAESVTGRPIPCTTDRGGRAIRRCSWPARRAPLRSWAGGPARPSLEEMVGSAWAWRQAHPGGYRGSRASRVPARRAAPGLPEGDCEHRAVPAATFRRAVQRDRCKDRLRSQSPAWLELPARMPDSVVLTSQLELSTDSSRCMTRSPTTLELGPAPAAAALPRLQRPRSGLSRSGGAPGPSLTPPATRPARQPRRIRPSRRGPARSARGR